MLLNAIAVFFFLVAMATQCLGTCADLSSPLHSDEEFRGYLDRFQAIFLGEVIAADPRDKSPQILRVRVLRTWKGVEGSEISLVYTAGDEEYGFPNIGSQEIFYALASTDGGFVIPHCGKGYWQQDERMKSLLGQGREIAISEQPAPEQKSFWSWLWDTIESPFT